MFNAQLQIMCITNTQENEKHISQTRKLICTNSKLD